MLCPQTGSRFYAFRFTENSWGEHRRFLCITNLQTLEILFKQIRSEIPATPLYKRGGEGGIFMILGAQKLPSAIRQCLFLFFAAMLRLVLCGLIYSPIEGELFFGVDDKRFSLFCPDYFPSFLQGLKVYLHSFSPEIILQGLAELFPSQREEV